MNIYKTSVTSSDIGKKVLLDYNLNKGVEVILIDFYEGTHCRVKDPEDGSEWSVGKYRLRKLKQRK